MKGLGKKRITGQHRDTLAEYLVRGGLSPAQIIVVQSGKIIMNDGVGMDELEGTGKRKERLAFSPEELAAGQRQNRAKPLASGEKAVVHGLTKCLRVADTPLEVPMERPVNDGFSLCKILLDVETGHASRHLLANLTYGNSCVPS